MSNAAKKTKKVTEAQMAEILRALKSGAEYAKEAAAFYGTNWRGEVALKEAERVVALFKDLGEDYSKI